MSATIADIVSLWRELKALVPEPLAYELRMTLDTYRLLWNMRTPTQRKLARMVNSSACPPLKHNVSRR